jgi:IS30 family transposase
MDQYVYADKRRGGDLHAHLRCQKKRRKRYGSNDRRSQIRGWIPIDERPEIVEDAPASETGRPTR